MTRVGILSDTHGFYDKKLEDFFEGCDIILHAGDIGNLEITHSISLKRKLVAVSGNIDNHITRMVHPLFERVTIEEVSIIMTHIGGYPGTYNRQLYQMIVEQRPQIVVCGHSHILKVIYDKKLEHLHINPGAAGVHGFHKERTAIRVSIDKERIFDMEVGSWPRGGHLQGEML